jgi:hypothetical protein
LKAWQQCQAFLWAGIGFISNNINESVKVSLPLMGENGIFYPQKSFRI